LKRAQLILGFDADVKQSDSESELIKWLHEAADSKMPVIINPACIHTLFVCN
jgi:3-dehydroquinate dehydratase